MHFQVRVPKISGDVVALYSVVDAMAMAKATAFGATEFHQAAYDGLVANISASLLIEAKKGGLQVCDQNGIAASADELIERVKRTGMYIVASQYVVEPNWQALKKAHPERETAPECWNWSGIDLGESKFDDVASELRCLCATLKHLNDWGVSAGNSFSLDPNAPPWIDERGVMGLTENLAADGETITTQKVDAGATADGGVQAHNSKVGVGDTVTEDDATSNRHHKKGAKWTDDELKNLLHNYKGGKTQEHLADFHGVKRQCISRLLQRADAKFAPTRGTDMSMVAQAKRVVTFGNDK